MNDNFNKIFVNETNFQSLMCDKLSVVILT